MPNKALERMPGSAGTSGLQSDVAGALPGIAQLGRSAAAKQHTSMKTTTQSLVLAALFAASSGLTAEFADWTNVNSTVEIAEGVLDGIPVTLTGGDITPSFVIDGSSTVFDSPLFTPRLRVSDVMELIGSPTGPVYTVTFASPVRDPIVHLRSLASTLVFNTTNITRLSGDDVFRVSGATVSGALVPSGADANGSVRLDGDFTSFSFSAHYTATSHDGIAFQLGGTDPRLLRVSIMVADVDVCWNSKSNATYQVEYQSELTTNVWTVLRSPVPGTGSSQCITDAVRGQEKRFYRVRELP
jgi:hypothetical protein